jgi:hypothetical protein
MHKGEYNLRHVVLIVVAKGLKPEALKALKALNITNIPLNLL